MKRRLRLRGRRDFQALVTGRRLYAGSGFIGFARSGTTAGMRVGVAVSRQVKGSIARNLARRRLREAVRLGLLPALSDWSQARPGITFDVVLIARPAAGEIVFESLRRESIEFAGRLGALAPPGSPSSSRAVAVTTPPALTTLTRPWSGTGCCGARGWAGNGSPAATPSQPGATIQSREPYV